MATALGLDVGGTKIAAGVVDDAGRVLASVRRPSPTHDFAAALAVIDEIVESLGREHEVSAIGIGAPGFVDNDMSTISLAPNLGWRNVNLGAAVADRTGLPTVVENDANAAAWAEYRFGAAQGLGSAVILTIGTGIGGGILEGGRLVRGRYGFAAEVGHIEIKADGRRCSCGLRGCWERYGSGTALVHEARELATVAPANARRLLELAGGDVQRIDGPVVTEAALQLDPTALEIFAIVGTWIGRGMAQLAAVLDPAAFVLAGGVAEAGEILRAPAVAALEQRLTARSFRTAPQVLLTGLSGQAGIVGAADLARAGSAAPAGV
ncbi:ROK family glucokinase [Puerhibacterium puerhi]|uniref:ROK family glucokinase n=1 Tax=Puerhibacterium puerhi TaxID=2692623 RepID=UPI00135C9A0F|nr:ROK family glucokinase [Puerhibacterium puerhi]